MNTSALKTFAPAVRKQLMEAVTRKLDFVLTGDTADLRAMSAQRESLRRESERDRSGLIERVAYTWFNRFAALRFMDARGWHPFRARILTAASASETQPELLKLTRTGALPEDLRLHTDPARLNDLLDGRIPSSDAQGEVYRHLVLAACRFYHALLPNVFEKLDDETELLLPDDLLTEHSVVHGFRTEISDEDCGDGQRANVEILGWLYQFYISEKKDRVMARKSAVPIEDIPAVTQLFTPHWIVRYLVENSLGRLWLLNRPSSRLREHMPYYIEGEDNAPGGSPADFLKITKPEEIRLCDPAVGSGHMLTYAFDLLTLIYEEEGYAPTEVPALILRHNLHGLEICPRAAQLAELALVFKAREKSRRFFQPEHLVRPYIIELRDVRFAENELADYFKAIGLASDSQLSTLNTQLTKLLHQFEEAKNFGSLIQPCLDERAIADVRRAIEAKDLGGQLFLRETHLKVLRVLEQAEALTQRYHVVVANPPYMGGGNMNHEMRGFVKKQLPEGMANLYACFIARNLRLACEHGAVAMINLSTWMFLEDFKALRKSVLSTATIRSLIHNGRGVWGSDFDSCAFVLANDISDQAGLFKRLYEREFNVQSNEELQNNFFNTSDYPLHRASTSDFLAIPSSPIVFWLSRTSYEIFNKMDRLSDSADLKVGLQTGDNERFLRLWFEMSHGGISFSGPGNAKWYPYSKGGEFRKWFGNALHVINWENSGREVRNCRNEKGKLKSRPQNMNYYFREAIEWSDVGQSIIGARFRPLNYHFDVVAMSSFYKTGSAVSLMQVQCLLNSVVAGRYMNVIAPGMHYNTGYVGKLPFSERVAESVDPSLGEEAVKIARSDWDNFETSWDFRDQPLLRPGLKGATLEASWQNWEAQSTAAILRMQELETENNRLFIAAYGLDGELQPEVPEEQITLARAEARRDMAAFLSYAVGCMMGRYGLDHPGLILANAGDSLREFLEKVGKPLAELAFAPDEDGIIPVLDGEWFEDDIVARTRDFLRATFGPETLNENLRFIEAALGKDLRKYFLTDFYRDHLQTYKKRPIYWMVQSPKRGFAVLIYLHRYTKDTFNGVLNRYLRDYQAKLRNRLAHLTEEQATASTAKAKTDARKESEKLSKILRECVDWERQVLLPLAQQRIELDLDDGVKVNYLKLAEALAPIAGLAAKEED